MSDLRGRYRLSEQTVADIMAVSGAEHVDAMRFVAERMEMVVEPTGTLGLAVTRRTRTEREGSVAAC